MYTRLDPQPHLGQNETNYQSLMLTQHLKLDLT